MSSSVKELVAVAWLPNPAPPARPVNCQPLFLSLNLLWASWQGCSTSALLPVRLAGPLLCVCRQGPSCVMQGAQHPGLCPPDARSALPCSRVNSICFPGRGSLKTCPSRAFALGERLRRLRTATENLLLTLDGARPKASKRFLWRAQQ